MGEADLHADLHCSPATAVRNLPLPAVLGALEEGVIVVGPDGGILTCNRSAERILGLSADQMTGRTTQDPRWQAIREDGSPFPAEAHPVSVTLRTGVPVRGTIMGIRRPGGELTWISLGCQPLFPPGQARPSVVASFTDITSLKRAAAALEESEASFRLLFDANPVPMWVYDRESLRFLAVNEAVVRHYGYPRAEFERLTLLDIRPPEEVARFLERSRDLSFRRSGLSQGEWTHRTRDGSLIQVDVCVGEITFRGRAAMLAVIRDVTEHNKMQAQLVQLQKMEAVSRLAGSLAHDFNNLLGVISGYADLLGREIGREDPRRRRIDQMRSAIESGASLTRQLLVFSRRAETAMRPLDLHALTASLQPMLARVIGVDHELITRLEPGTTMVKADKGQLEQVVLNLALNARDAMPGGGKLILETGRVTLDEAFARTHLEAAPGRYAVLSVSDTGCGMDAATRARIFEPFFTTKPEGQGTGLGLATVYGIVKRCGGSISVYSEVGQGTTFKILLPLLESAASATAAHAETDTAHSPGAGTILLVEDGDAMRAMMRELLETSGYTVLEADSPRSAETVLAAHQGPLDLLLTDVVLPGMRGPALADRVRRERPDVKVLFMSGYTDETVAAQGLVDKDALFVQKPFNAATLLGRVRAALEAPPGP